MIEHPFLPDLTELSIDDLQEKISQAGIAQLCLGIFPSYKNWIIDN